MFDLLLQFSIGFTIALSGALIPGPLLAFITMKTLNSGPKSGSLAAIGHIIVEIGIVSLIAFGLGTFLKSQIFTLSIGTVGGILLLGLGLSILRRIREPEKGTKEIAGGKHHPITGGILFSTIFNPSVALWWMTVGLATLTSAIRETGVIGGGFWLAGHFSADIGWFSSMSYSIHKGKRIIGSKFYRGLLIACSLTLLIFGGYFAFNYLPKLLSILQ